MQFNIVVCGLDSIEARRWINSTLVDMVDMDNPDSFKPLIDGGTEGMALVYKIKVTAEYFQDLRDNPASSTQQ